MLSISILKSSHELEFLNKVPYFKVSYFDSIDELFKSCTPQCLVILDLNDYLKNKNLMLESMRKIDDMIILFVYKSFDEYPSDDTLKELDFCDCEFIRYPIPENIFINRIKLLRKLSKKFQSKMKEKTELIESMWEMMEYATFYIVLTDKDLNIRICNKVLRETLGYPNESDIIGKSWLEFIPPFNTNLIKNIGHNIIDGNEVYKEIINEIITKDGDLMMVKWFNSKVTNGEESIFSLGVPVPNNVDDTKTSFEDMRDFWKHIVNTDRLIIRDELKQILNKEAGINPASTCTLIT